MNWKNTPLAQNNPNPFNVTIDVNLTVAESGPDTMEITDVEEMDYANLWGKHMSRCFCDISNLSF